MIIICYHIIKELQDTVAGSQAVDLALPAFPKLYRTKTPCTFLVRFYMSVCHFVNILPDSTNKTAAGQVP